MRLREIDLLRGIAIILVIVGHSFILHPVNIHDVSWCLNTFNWIYTFHMELFFLLAGCVYHCVNYKKFFRKKVDRILVPYLLFGLISMVLAASSIGAVNRHLSWMDGINKLFFHGGEYWFLYVLFIIFAIYPLIERIILKGWQKVLLITVLMILPNLVSLPSLFMIKVVAYQLPYFIIGVMVAKHLGDLREIKCHYAIVASLFSIGLYAVTEPKIGVGGVFCVTQTSESTANDNTLLFPDDRTIEDRNEIEARVTLLSIFRRM